VCRDDPHQDDAWTEWGGDGAPLHFAHANGFPPPSYRSLLERLTGDFRVVTFGARPLWSDDPPTSLQSWTPLADDLGDALERRGLDGVVGVGHSLGGALTAMAAAGRPGLFSALVLVDPVVFTFPRTWVWGAMKGLGQGGRLPLVRGARRRRGRWPDRATVAAAYREKPAFSGWTDTAFSDYLEAGFVTDDGGVRLRYPKAWEARIFEVTPASVWPALRRVDVPVLFLRGETSTTFLVSAATRATREMADARVIELADRSHFLPFEDPDGVAKVIRDFVGEVVE
jgi:pimeloyl-ACP methyl ester carboxylesterase